MTQPIGMHTILLQDLLCAIRLCSWISACITFLTTLRLIRVSDRAQRTTEVPWILWRGRKKLQQAFRRVSLCPWSSQTSRFNWPGLMQTGKALPRTSHLPFRKLVTFWLNNRQGKRASPLPSLEKPSLACLLALRFSSRVPLRQSSKTLLLKSRTEVSRTAF